MTKQEILLGKAIKEYKDFSNKAYIIPCAYFNSDNGFAYVIKDESSKTEITCSVFMNVVNNQESIKNSDTGTVGVLTQEDVFELFERETTFYLLEYDDYYIGIDRLSGFNKINNTYAYDGQVIKNTNAEFIVTSETEAAEILNSDSTTKWIEFGSYCGITLYPSFLAPVNKSGTYLSVEILESKSIGPVWQYDDTTKKQKKIDTCKLSLVNGTLNQAQNVAEYLDKQVDEQGFFGLMETFPGFSQHNNFLQSGFNIKSNVKTANIKINYTLDSDSEETLKYITEALFTMSAVNYTGG